MPPTFDADQLVEIIKGPATPVENGAAAAIEHQRARMKRSTRSVLAINGKRRPIPTLPAMSEAWGRRIFRLVRALRPASCLELGTSSGMSAAYIASALKVNDEGSLITLEAAAEVASVARRNLQDLALDRIALVEVGAFREVLARELPRLPADFFDLVFVDGHHDHDATLEYFETLLANIRDGGVVLFDDITWSKGMRRAWSKIVRHSRVKTWRGLGRMGLVTCTRGAGEDQRIDR
jgi:predicted O-methyltransferase YrrM